MNMVFGQKLKELRNNKHLTQKQLAEKFKVSKTTVCQWETSKQEPSFDNLTAMAKFFEVTTDYLLGLED